MVPPYQVIRNTVSLRSICNNQYLWVWVCTEMQTISVQVAWFSLLLFRILGPMYSHVLQSLESYNSSWGLSCCMLHAATCSYWTGTCPLLLLPFFLPYWSSHGPIRVQDLKSVSSFIFMIVVTTIKSSSLSLSLFLSTSSPSGCYRLLSAMSSPLLPSPPTDLCHQLLQCKVKIGPDTEWTKIWYLGVLKKKKKKNDLDACHNNHTAIHLVWISNWVKLLAWSVYLPLHVFVHDWNDKSPLSMEW